MTTPERKCIECPTGCSTCTSSTVCTACIATYFMSGTLCVNPCPDGTYGDIGTGNCENCHSTCKTCTGSSDTVCTVCKETP